MDTHTVTTRYVLSFTVNMQRNTFIISTVSVRIRLSAICEIIARLTRDISILPYKYQAGESLD